MTIGIISLSTPTVLPEGRDEISPNFFLKQKNSSQNHPNLHLKTFNKLS